MGTYKQLDFSGGMDLMSSPTNIANNAYRESFNVRSSRSTGKLTACAGSINITYNLQGVFQGIYAFNNVWVTFYSGKAYYMLTGGTSWTQVTGFQMSVSAPKIYAAAVPDSSDNYFRQAAEGANGVANAAGSIILSTTLNGNVVLQGTPAGIVCQDGINQPMIIFYDPVAQVATSRTLGTFTTWTQSNPEYVPIGLQMMYLSPILYIVGAGANANIVYRSVSGAPLNFMVNVDTNGNKSSSETLGGAQTTSFAQDNLPINALVPSTTAIGSFLLSNALYTYVMVPDYTDTIFGEPTFNVQGLLPVGAVNQFCVTDSNGDTPIISFDGVKSFNQVQTLKFSGKNAPFSKNLAKILKGIVQNICCCVAYDNYNLFALNSTVGYIIAVYDNMLNQWVGMDLSLPCSGGIVQFALAVYQDNYFLAAANSQNQIWLMYSDPVNTEAGTLTMREFMSGGLSITGTFLTNPATFETKIEAVKAVVNSGTIAGNISCSTFVDERADQYKSTPIIPQIDGVSYPVRPPVIPANERRLQNVVFSLDQGQCGYRATPVLAWTGDMSIERVDVLTNDVPQQVSTAEQQNEVFGNIP